MKKIYFFIFILLCFLLSACQDEPPNLGIAQKYLPKASLVQKGIVNKYYVHYLPTEKQDISTHIEYRSFQLNSEGKLYENIYNPAMKPTTSREWTFDNNQMLLKKEASYGYWRQDTFKHEVLNPIGYNWESETAGLEKIIYYPEFSRKWERVQKARRDTTILNKPAILFEIENKYTTYTDGDTIPGHSIFEGKIIFAQDLGLYYLESTSSRGKSWTELVEQIPMETFKKMANHGRQRVAYINPQEAMDKDVDFKLCETKRDPYDYYNGSDLYGYQGGKRVVWDYINEHLDETKLLEESGYLTFRFIVNCKGEAGRFITEQADLNFQRKEFNPATVAHCYELLSGLKDWDPTHIDGETVDAFFYFTFKLRNGVLIDILPKF